METNSIYGPADIQEPNRMGEARISFCIDRRIDKEKTEQKKYAVWQNYVAFNACVDLRQNVFLEATDQHKEEYPREWAKFEASDEYKDFLRQQATADPGDAEKELRQAEADAKAELEAMAGQTPLDKLQGVGPALKQQLNAVGIHGIEQLAEKSVGEVPELRGRNSAEQLIARARTYVSANDLSGRG